MRKGDRIAIVCCSNGQKKENGRQIDKLGKTLLKMGIMAVFSRYIYEQDGVEGGSTVERANNLMDFYKDDSIKGIFDISGGDIANTMLPFLDYEVIAKSEKKFWGYSDLTTIINAIYAKTGKSSILYQIRNLIYDCANIQVKNFSNAIYEKNDELFHLSYEFCQGEKMEGVVVGGNIRCLLKLAGTDFFPDMKEKILLLEAYSGTKAQLLTYYSQLQQMGVFENIRGILLGTFTQMKNEKSNPNEYELLKEFINPTMPVAKTMEIGHGTDSKAIEIGKFYSLK